jgi:hypothetical protein
LTDKLLVECETSDGRSEEFYADYVISTLPIGVMKSNHKNLFYPGLTDQKVEQRERKREREREREQAENLSVHYSFH